ncbi:Transcription factor DIVARICATA [Glycine soja]|uniref:Transcription factor DIVARICATA n=1 Tax=Glycine soja TaxID=3848 RepID=A0A445F1Q3_GLYSO|nr:Transcription factor DIVARICATA [Glycine soja]
MKWESITLSSPTPCTPNSNTNWLVMEDNNRSSTKWTSEDKKLFENALAVHDKDTPDQWHKVAKMILGKIVVDVIRKYKELEVDISNIETVLIPVPGYSSIATSPFTLDWVNTHGYDGFKGYGKRSSSLRPIEHERKKGVPRTEDEHKTGGWSLKLIGVWTRILYLEFELPFNVPCILFLLGLKKYGKGDWTNICCNFVITRTPTQVGSHAQKYFIRQLSGGKDKSRASIHDKTTVNLTETITTSSEDTNRSTSPHVLSSNNSQILLLLHQELVFNGVAFDLNFAPCLVVALFITLAMTLNPGHERIFMSHYGANSFGVKIEGQNIHESSYLGPQTQNMVFQMQQSSQH